MGSLGAGHGLTVADFRRDVYCLLGLPFDAMSLADAVQRLRNAAERRTQCVLVTPNTNWIVSCLTDAGFRDSATSSDLSLLDGRPLVWIARLLRIPIPEAVPGSTLLDRLREKGERRLSVFFFGGAEGAAEKACRRLQLENQGLTCAGYDSAGFGSLDTMSRDELIDRINISNADFLIVALGARKGQAWIERNRASITVPLISHLGAAVNFVAGTVRRAPGWMQEMGLEWLWRIKEEPVLWLRYLSDGIALLGLLLRRVGPYAWHLRHRAPTVPPSVCAVEAREDSGEYVIRLSGTFTHDNLDRLRTCYECAAAARTSVRLELDGTTYVDSAFVGLTILLQASQRKLGKSFRLVGARETVRRIIRYCCAEYLFSANRSVEPAGVG